MDARHQRCSLLVGPAGVGKTSLLTAWRRQLIVAGSDVAWVALNPEDDDPTRFFDALLAGLRSVDPFLVRDAEVLAARGLAESEAEALVIAVVRAISARRRHVVVVMDDVHHLRNACVISALQLLLDYAPPELHLSMASRTEPVVALGRLRAQRQVEEIGTEDLRFTIDEATRFAERYLEGMDARQVQALYASTDGWAAGLKLVALDLRRHHPRPPEAQAGVHDSVTFARYLEHEVLAHLEAAELDLLVACAVPEHFDAEFATTVAGAGGGHAELLAQWEQQGLFLLPAGPRYPSGWWRMHRLLRDGLLARFALWPETKQTRLHAAATAYFSDRGMTYDAVRHALRAGAVAKAMDLAEGSAPELFVRGDLRELVGLVRLLPEAAVRERGGLRLWLGYAQLYALRLDECARSIEQLQVDLASAAHSQRFRLTLLRGLYAIQRDDSAAAMALLPELMDAPADADSVALSGRRLLLTWIHLYNGNYQMARRVQADRPTATGNEHPVYGTALGALAGCCLVGLVHAVQGQVIQAERIYRDVLYEADKRGADCADAGALAAGLLGEVLYELNDSAGALALLEPRLDVLEKVSIPDTLVRVALSLGRSRWLSGRPLDALDGLEHAEARAQRMGLDRIRAYCLLEKLQFRLRRRELALAEVAMVELNRLDERHADTATGVLSEILVAAERGRIRIALYTGNLDDALRRLDVLIVLCRERGRERRVPFLQLQAAGAERALGRFDSARARVQEALRLGHDLGLVRTMLDAHEDVLPMLREARQDARLDPILGFYAERLEAAALDVAPDATVKHASRLPGLDVLSPREFEIVQLLLQAQSNKKIARALDLSLDTVKWHLKNVYAKLEVSGREQVLERFRR